MSRLLAIAWNHITHEFDRSTIVFFLILPLLFTVIVGSALSGAATRAVIHARWWPSSISIRTHCPEFVQRCRLQVCGAEALSQERSRSGV
jgi:hypothetical protein